MTPELFFGIIDRFIALPKVAGMVVFGIALFGHLQGVFLVTGYLEWLLFAFSFGLGFLLWDAFRKLYRSAAQRDKWLSLYWRHVTLPLEQKVLVGRSLKSNSKWVSTDQARRFDMRDRLPADQFQIFLQRELGTMNNGVFSYDHYYWKWLNHRRLVLINLHDNHHVAPGARD